jgi:hypothetical protein
MEHPVVDFIAISEKPWASGEFRVIMVLSV